MSPLREAPARVELVLKLEPLLRKLAKENQQQSKGRGKKGQQKSANLKPVETREELAKAAGVSAKTYQQAKKVVQAAKEPTGDGGREAGEYASAPSC